MNNEEENNFYELGIVIDNDSLIVVAFNIDLPNEFFYITQNEMKYISSLLNNKKADKLDFFIDKKNISYEYLPDHIDKSNNNLYKLKIKMTRDIMNRFEYLYK